MDANLTLIDRWTPGHFIAGFIAGLYAVPLGWFIALHGAYDLIEQAVERTPAGAVIFATSGPENVTNIIGDTTAALMGWRIGKELRNAQS